MIEALRTLFSSKKFQTLIIGLMITAGARFGLSLDGETCAAILGLVAVLIHAQGQADLGKEAAKINLAAPPSNDNVTNVSVEAPKVTSGGAQLPLLMVLLLAGAASSQISCGALKGHGESVAGHVIDCLSPTAKAAVTELKPTFGDLLKNAVSNTGKMDWVPVKSAASSLKSAALQCAFTAAITEVLSSKHVAGALMSSPLEVDAADVKAGFEDIRTQYFAGAKFKLESGVQ